MAGLDNPCLVGVDLVCNKARLTPLLVSKHSFMVCFTNFMQASTCALLWWLYGNDSTWWISPYCRILGILLKSNLWQHQTLFLFGRSYPTKTSLLLLISWLTDSPSVSHNYQELTVIICNATVICLIKSKYISAYLFSMVCQGSCGPISSLWVVFASIHAKEFLLIFQCHH